MWKDESTNTETIAMCAIVGNISMNRLALDPQGNYNPTFANSKLLTSKIQFQLIASKDDEDFNSDFNIALQHVSDLQKAIITNGPGPEHFIVTDGNEKALRFGCPIFEKRVSNLYLTKKIVLTMLNF